MNRNKKPIGLPRKVISPAKFPNESVELVSITLYQSDGIRVIGASQDLVNLLRIEIHKTWGWGEIREEFQFHHCYEFKLKGLPWFGIDRDAVRARQVIIGILKCMAINGWNLMHSVDLSKMSFDADTIFFQKGYYDHKAEIFAVSMTMYNRIWLIEPSLRCFKKLGTTFKDILNTRWAKGIQGEVDYNFYVEYHLGGDPWKFLDPMESYRAKLLMTRIIAGLASSGFKLYGTINMNTGKRDNADMDTLFFRNVTNIWPVRIEKAKWPIFS